MYYGARYYDYILGRFISADTIVPGAMNPQALNRYSYVLNNPLKYTDPTGHFAILGVLIGVKEIAIFGGLALGGMYIGNELSWGPNAAQNRQALANALETIGEGLLSAGKYDGTPQPLGRPQPPPPLDSQGQNLIDDIPVIGKLPPGPIRNAGLAILAATAAGTIWASQHGMELGDVPYSRKPQPPSPSPKSPCGDASVCIRAPEPKPEFQPSPGSPPIFDDPRLVPIPY